MLSRGFNIHHKDFIGSLIYFLSTRFYLSFAVQKLETFSENSDIVYSKILVHLLIYIRYKKTLGLKYYADMKYAPLSNLLRQANIMNENQLMAFSDFS